MEKRLAGSLGDVGQIDQTSLTILVVPFFIYFLFYFKLSIDIGFYFQFYVSDSNLIFSLFLSKTLIDSFFHKKWRRLGELNPGQQTMINHDVYKI